MAEQSGSDGKPSVSFGFTKKIDTKKLQKSVVSDELGSEDKAKDFVFSLEGREVKSAKPKEGPKQYVIPLIRENNWRPVLNESDADMAKVTNKMEDEAVREVLADANKLNENWDDRGGDKVNPNLQIPLLMQNKVPEGFETEDKLDVSLRPDAPNVIDYDEIPIDHFGKAMLRGMGWTEGKGIGKNQKAVAPVEAVVRPKGLGLGADRSQTQQKEKNGGTATTNNKNQNDTDLKIKKGAFCTILKGVKKDLYGTVEGVDEDNSRVMVKMALTGKVETLSQFAIRLVDKAEYDKYSKYLNKGKSDKYKEEEERKKKIEKEKEMQSGRSSSDDSSDSESSRSSKSQSQSPSNRREQSNGNGRKNGSRNQSRSSSRSMERKSSSPLKRSSSRSPSKGRSSSPANRSRSRSKASIKGKERPRSKSNSPVKSRKENRNSRSPKKTRRKSTSSSRSRSKSPVKSGKRSRSRSKSVVKSRKKSRSSSRSRSPVKGRKRSESPAHKRKRSKSDSRSRSKSPVKSRKRSRSASRSRSRSRVKSRRRSRSRSRSRSRRRSRSRSRRRRQSYRSRSRSRGRRRHSRSRSRGRYRRSPSPQYSSYRRQKIYEEKRRRYDDYREREEARKRMEEREREKERQRRNASLARRREKEVQKKMCAGTWVRANMRVRIIDKSIGDGNFFKEKVVVEDVPGIDNIICKTSGGKILENIKESQLETVIPKGESNTIVILYGKYKGLLGDIIKRDKENNKAMLELLRDRGTLLNLDYDSICEYVGEVDSDYCF